MNRTRGAVCNICKQHMIPVHRGWLCVVCFSTWGNWQMAGPDIPIPPTDPPTEGENGTQS